MGTTGRRVAWLVSVLLSAGVWGCGESTPDSNGAEVVGDAGLDAVPDLPDFGPNGVTARAYDQTCVYAEECVVVTDGDLCACPTCPTAALRQEEEEAFQAEVAAKACDVDVDRDCPTLRCLEQTTTCVDGTCGIRPAVYIEANNYDRSCSADTDCAAIAEGEICQPCRCINAAINVLEIERHRMDRELFACQTRQTECTCMDVVARCIDGSCQVEER